MHRWKRGKRPDNEEASHSLIPVGFSVEIQGQPSNAQLRRMGRKNT